MVTGLFLFSKDHDSVINIAGALAMIAVAGTFVGLYKNKWLGLFWFGIQHDIDCAEQFYIL